MADVDFRVLAIPLVNAGIYTLLTEQLVGVRVVPRAQPARMGADWDWVNPAGTGSPRWRVEHSNSNEYVSGFDLLVIPLSQGPNAMHILRLGTLIPSRRQSRTHVHSIHLWRDMLHRRGVASDCFLWHLQGAHPTVGGRGNI
jgi:hypothetical protein